MSEGIKAEHSGGKIYSNSRKLLGFKVWGEGEEGTNLNSVYRGDNSSTSMDILESSASIYKEVVLVFFFTFFLKSNQRSSCRHDWYCTIIWHPCVDDTLYKTYLAPKI